MDYKQAGVDIEKADEFVSQLRQKVEATYGPLKNKITAGVGGFASLYHLGQERYLATSTDGVGTKLAIAQSLKIHHTIGVDLVAMCVNDIICTGARPLLFLDYLACGKLELKCHQEVIDGIIAGCKQAHAALVGGETAEMPDFYPQGKYDLAGFCVGEAHKSEFFPIEKMAKGDAIIGLASSGFHSNGYSLIRKLIKEDEVALLKQALTPTTIYVDTISDLKAKFKHKLKGVANITGGGLDNIARINPNKHYKIDFLPAWNQLPSIMPEVFKRSSLPLESLAKTFNMGIGMALITNDFEAVLEHLDSTGITAWKIGEVDEGEHLKLGEVSVDCLDNLLN